MERTVIAAVDDMFFASKIRATAEHLGVKVIFPRTVAAVIDAARSNSPQTIVVDLHSQKLDSESLARQLKSDQQLQSIQLIGFFSHVETELQRRAEAAGFDQVMPRSAFTKNLAEILERS